MLDRTELYLIQIVDLIFYLVLDLNFLLQPLLALRIDLINIQFQLIDYQEYDLVLIITVVNMHDL